MKADTSELEIDGESIVANGEAIPLASITKVNLELRLHKRIFAKKVLKIFTADKEQAVQLAMVLKPTDETYQREAKRLANVVTELFEKLPNTLFEIKPSINAIKVAIFIIALLTVLGFTVIWGYLYQNSNRNFDYKNLLDVNWPILIFSLVPIGIGSRILMGEKYRFKKPFKLNEENYKREIRYFFQDLAP